jgi:hypothetical protein
MQHAAQIQKEFVKHAGKWDDLSYQTQKEYLMSHPGTKKRITAPITDIHSWAKTKKFMNLDTHEPSNFEDLPERQQEALKAKFEQEKVTHGEVLEKQKAEGKVKREKVMHYTIMGDVGEGDDIKGDTPEEVMIKYLVKHEEYSPERAEQEVKANPGVEKDGIVTFGNYEIKPVLAKERVKKEKTEKSVRKMSERKVKRLARRVRRDLKAAGKYDEGDDFTLEIAAKFIQEHPELKQYFVDKGIEEKDMATKFAEFI